MLPDSSILPPPQQGKIQLQPPGPLKPPERYVGILPAEGHPGKAGGWISLTMDRENHIMDNMDLNAA